MDRDELRAALADELAALLDCDSLVLSDATRASDIAGWDSLVHLKLLVALEGAFRVKFQLSEMNAAENVGALVDLIAAKRAAA
jgi:acyl carrier protein